MSRSQQSFAYEETHVVHPWSKYPWRKSYVVWTVSGATLLCFLAVISNPHLYQVLAMSCGKGFRIWQPLSASFTEANFLSLLGFISLQLFFGVPLEHEWTRRDLALAYLLSGIGANLLLVLAASPALRFAGPLGAVSGLLAAAWRNLPNQDCKFFMIITVRLHILIAVIVAAIIILCLLSTTPVIALVPTAGFAIGFLYCLLEKNLQCREAARTPNKSQRISNIEID